MGVASTSLLLLSITSWAAHLHAFEFPPLSELQPSTEATALDAPQFIYNGKELADGLRSAYANGKPL